MNRAALLGIAALAACSGKIRFHVDSDGGDRKEAAAEAHPELGSDLGPDRDDAAGVDLGTDLGIDTSPDLALDRGVDAEGDTGIDTRGDTGIDATPAPGTCNVEGQCPVGLHCDTAAKRCVVCLGSGDCQTTGLRFCDTSTRRCVRCLGAGDCDPGQTCSTGRRCVTTCIKNVMENCPAAANHCEDDTGTGLCAPCDDNLVCTGGGGGTICLRSEGVCVQCSSDASCTGSTTHCDPVTNRCVTCTSNAHCTQAGAPFCNPTTGTCVGPR